MTQLNIAETSSLDVWAQSGGAIVGMAEIAVSKDEELHAAAFTFDAICSHEPAREMSAAAFTVGLSCFGRETELSAPELQAAAFTRGGGGGGGWGW